MRGIAVLLPLLWLPCAPEARGAERFVDQDEHGGLIYEADSQGNRIPDFSHAGYGGGGVPIPEAPPRIRILPSGEDDGHAIQSALDHLATLPPDSGGIRGAVVLAPGRFEVEGQLVLRSSGVALRGAGVEATTLVATGRGRRALVAIRGNDRKILGAPRPVRQDYVAVGATRLLLDSTEGLEPGSRVLVRRPSPAAWVERMGMSSMQGRPAPVWKEDTLDILWERTVESAQGGELILREPLTCALEARFGGGEVVPLLSSGRVRRCGVEDLTLVSWWDRDNPKHEDHAWTGISMDHAEDAWARNVHGRHFAGSLVFLGSSARRVTVMDCLSEAPVSETGGYRRHTFHTAGEQTLFLRCRAEGGRRDFTAGWTAPGPNAFVDCESVRALDFSGPIESWATGVLYDSLEMDGGSLRFDNREIWDNGIGWAAANCVAWRCRAPVLVNRRPPGASNWAIGCWGQFVGDGRWRSPNASVEPESLYRAQLAERMGRDAAECLEARPALPVPQRIPHWEPPPLASPDPPPYPDLPMSLRNGWILAGDRLRIGRQPPITWWRGHALPSRSGEFGINLTRHVPGRTDDLARLARSLAEDGAAALRHHPGLWYDRRRDDHQMSRRTDGDVWPPFYEMPWARSGRGTAWDGLSRYDLASFNPWYFGRLEEFARLAGAEGLILVSQMYFQHNLLEAGAHWADYPWRPANNINDTGLPEPPPYVGRKRILMAGAFYDLDHPGRRELHRRYIRRSLENHARTPNVIHMLGEEYSGPLHFMEFWLDCVQEWIEDHPQLPDPAIALSAPRDVQDAVLAQPDRSRVVDAIDFKYWWRSPRGLFAPEGGKDLSPRQHQRLWRGGGPTDETLAEMAAEYRESHSSKAVMCAFGMAGWAYLCAGGSLPVLPRGTEEGLLAALPGMGPWVADAGKRLWGLWDPAAGGGLVYHGGSSSLALALPSGKDAFLVSSIDRSTGQSGKPFLASGKDLVLDPGPSVTWIRPSGGG